MFPPLNFDSKSCTTKHLLMFFKMDNIIQIERLRYAKICRERRSFHGLINNCSSKSENLKPQGSLRTLLLFCFLFRSSPRNLFSKVAVLKFRKITWKTPAVDYCFSYRTKILISTETELRSMLSLEIWSSYFPEYLRLIAVPKRSHRRWSIKKVFHKNFTIFTGKHLC